MSLFMQHNTAEDSHPFLMSIQHLPITTVLLKAVNEFCIISPPTQFHYDFTCATQLAHQGDGFSEGGRSQRHN